MALHVLPMDRLFRLASFQRSRQTGHELSQTDAYPSARVAVHIAPRKQQHIYA